MTSTAFLREHGTSGAKSPPRRVGLLPVGVGTVALSGLILYGPARSAMGGGAVALMLLHLALGLVLGVGTLAACLLRFRTARWPLTAAVAFCLGTGVLMVAQAAGGSRLSGSNTLLALHIATGLGAVALGWSSLTGTRRAGARSRAPLLLALLLPATAAALSAYRYEPEAYYRSLTATNEAQAGNPMFPAGVRLEGERRWIDRPAAYCGAVGCHESAYRDWLTSAHAAASSDPFYQASLRSYATRAGTPATRWCAGCHEPTSLVTASGQRGKDLTENAKTRRGEEREEGGFVSTSASRVRPFASSRSQSSIGTLHLASEPRVDGGVGCLGCHAATRVEDLTGNGRLVLAAPAEYPFAQRREPALRWLHAFLLRLRPAPHRAAFLKPELHPTSEFCSSCHRMSFNVPQNHYKFLPGMDEYGAWLESPISGQSIHGFHLADRQQQCADCHMPRQRGGPGGRSHAFLGGNTALPALRGDQAHRAATERFLRSDAVSVDLFALRRTVPGRPHQEELQAPLEDASDPLRPGDDVVVDVVVRNRAVGHDFPAGSGDLRDIWLAVTLRNASGRLLLANGLAGGDGTVDPAAHVYKLIALDRTGRRIDRNNLDEMVTVVLPFSPRAISAGESDLARYRFTVPRTAGRVKLTARLLHRAVNPVFAGWALGQSGKAQGPSVETAARKAQSPPTRTKSSVGGTARSVVRRLRAFPAAVSTDGPHPAAVPVTVIAEDSLTFVVAPAPVALTRVPVPAPGREAQAMRFYDYGVALLRQDDLARAARAMRRVAELLPRRPEGPRGLGRVYLEEGDLIAARDQFLAAMRLAPQDAQARLFLGRTYRKMGQYEGALAILNPIAARFPRDRALQFEIGQCYFLTGRYEEASKAFTRMLDIDPNDLAAHYNLMSCNRQLHRFPEARREEAVYRYLKEDESVRRLTADYLVAHPAVAREAQSIHEHRLLPVERREIRR